FFYKGYVILVYKTTSVFQYSLFIHTIFIHDINSERKRSKKDFAEFFIFLSIRKKKKKFKFNPKTR
ncbi:MAG: hypothetical protein MUF15_08490, partial [Acidobacteria bacterium]|nr:hypothetical protein [Acidobacteriota bacterium]